LNIEVDVRRHRVFTRNDDDIVTEVAVSYLDALLGGEVEVPTMTGKVALKVPAGTTLGRNFRMKGKGMPRHGRGATGHGDLVARMVISVPGELSDEEKALLEQLQTLQMDELEIVQDEVNGPGPEIESDSSGSGEDAGADA
jgi:molecular chaperone DnaJ